MPRLHLIPSLFQYRPFCVPDDKLFCKPSQYKRHSPNDFTETSGHETKIMPCYVQEVQIQPQSLLSKQAQQVCKTYKNSLESAATKVQQERTLPISLVQLNRQHPVCLCIFSFVWCMYWKNALPLTHKKQI